MDQVWYAIYQPVERLMKEANLRPNVGFVLLGLGALILYQRSPSNLWLGLSFYGLAYPVVWSATGTEADLIGHYKQSPASVN